MNQKQKEAYNEYVEQITPKPELGVHMLKAFITGGLICTFGQVILNVWENLGLDKDTSGCWSSLILVLCSVILTGFNLFVKIADFGGAGALVPITGFANSVAAPAIEFQAEGDVFGVGCRIFQIAGPVILYGIFTSSILGVVYWLLTLGA